MAFCTLQASKPSQDSQHPWLCGNASRDLRHELHNKIDSLQRPGWSLPQIKIRRDPKLFMQETPVLAMRVQE
jgi:hypothetical protein